jgi:hypothetical protein
MKKLQPIKFREFLLLFTSESVIITSAILKHALLNIKTEMLICTFVWV